jgi:hypothetical protein
VKPFEQWSAEEREKHALLEPGSAVAVNIRRHGNVMGEAARLVRPRGPHDAAGNPFMLGKDGDRATVIANYRQHYLPFRPSLVARLGELRGKALGCWSAPEPCHTDAFIDALRRRGNRAAVGDRCWRAPPGAGRPSTCPTWS